MNILFDASALLNIIRMLGENAVNYLRGNDILTLTPYEIGNALWKEAALLKTISIEEALALLNYADKVYGVMNMLPPSNCSLTLKIAYAIGATYYDSAYIVTAAENNLALATDDTGLSKKIRLHREKIRELLGKEIEILSTRNLAKQ